MHMDPVMPQLVGAVLLILILGFLLKLAKQPHVVAYLIAGVLIGPHGIALITDTEVIGRFGTIGVVLLLFFVGMETEPKKLLSNWKLAVIGTLVQILLSIFCIWGLGMWFDWPISRIILIGFVISLSSTAVVIKLLQDNNMLDTKVGQGVLSILLAQDLAIIPMLIILGILGTGDIDIGHLLKQSIGAIFALVLFSFVFRKKQLHLPLASWLKQDKELQLFAALGLCFGLALITAWFDLSTALGAFIAGLIIGVAKETQWVSHSLEPFKVLFIALFFVSVGMLLDLSFLLTHWPQAIALMIAAIFTNTFINALILKMAKYKWQDSLYSGVLLSQIGEFSFVLAAVGSQMEIINDFGYQLALCVISLSLLISPIWIGVAEKLLNWKNVDHSAPD